MSLVLHCKLCLLSNGKISILLGQILKIEHAKIKDIYQVTEQKRRENIDAVLELPF